MSMGSTTPPESGFVPGCYVADVVPACRACGSSKLVASYPADATENTICVECCGNTEHPDGESGHQFSFAPHEGHTCNYCGINRNDTAWRYDGDDE